MNEKLDKLNDKIDKLDSRLDSIDQTLIKNTVSLEYHIKRTDLLEKSLGDFQSEMKPVENHVMMVNGIVKLFGVISVLVGIIAGLFELFK